MIKCGISMENKTKGIYFFLFSLKVLAPTQSDNPMLSKSLIGLDIIDP